MKRKIAVRKLSMESALYKGLISCEDMWETLTEEQQSLVLPFIQFLDSEEIDIYQKKMAVAAIDNIYAALEREEIENGKNNGGK